MNAEVVIIGAGAVGCASAYFLARAGMKVTVLERDSVASHASGMAFGALNPLEGIPEPLAPIAQEGLRLHRELAETLRDETGVDTEFQHHPAFTVALGEQEERRLRSRLPWLKAQPGFQVEWHSGKELRAREPRLTPRVVGGYVTEPVGLVDPYRYTLALLQAAERRGATVRHGTARGLRFNGERVVGVAVGQEEVPCQAVVIAMGPWTGAASEWLSMPLPVEPLKGENLRLRVDAPPLPHISWGQGGCVSRPDGLITVGSTQERAGFDETPTAAGRNIMLERVVEVLPYLAAAQLVRHTACLRPVTPDGLLYLGLVPGKAGVVVATGAGRKGILYSPVVGQIVAELVAEGHTSWDISAFSLDRAVGEFPELPRPAAARE
ncbi:MAG: FAD-dependent oxidoreductase [Chloroflexi bacterium]|nr:FAD-dependent oxidoreductase [Chloroflexota bacterium]